MLRKVFRTGNSMVISLPREVLETLNLRDGSEIEINIDRQNRQMILKPVELPLAIAGVDETFARQVDEFIARYRSALENLAK